MDGPDRVAVKVPYGVRVVLTSSPFQDKDVTLLGAMASRAVVLLTSPVKESVEPEMLAPRTRYGP